MTTKAKSKALKSHFEKDEKKGIKDYEMAVKKTKGRERRVYKEILPQERTHLKKLKTI